MTHTTLILDVTGSCRGGAETLTACQALTDPHWDLRVIWSDAGGEAAAIRLVDMDARVTTQRVGSGTGICDWRMAVDGARGPHVVFLRPGDRLHADALGRWQQALAAHRGADWVLAAAADVPGSDWWFQPDLTESGAALLASGVAFPECAAMARREVWLRAAVANPDTVADPSRASAWLAIALAGRPALLSDVLAEASHAPRQIDAERLLRVVATLARQDPCRAAQLLVEVARLTAGLRIAQDTLFDALDEATRCFGATPDARAEAARWLGARDVVEALLTRGSREVWIWGAGQQGLEALAWLRAGEIPVAGFFDRDARRDGSVWGGLAVRDAALVRGGCGARVVVVASMFHDAIAADLRAAGCQEGRQFVVFRTDLPRWAAEAVA